MNALRAVNKLCTGCGICEMVCSLGHTGEVNPALARLRVVETEDEWRHPLICRHCDKPKCREACPIPDAMRIDRYTGAVVIDPESCDLCGACAASCPFGALFIGPGGRPLKCDLCGGDPLCVKYCFRRPARQFGNAPPTDQSCLRYEQGSAEP